MMKLTKEPDAITFSPEEPIGFERTADGKLIISGYSVHTGIYQNDTVEIPYSELSNIRDTLKGQKILKNHDAGDVDALIGRITDTKIGLDKNVGKKGVKYKGVIRDTNTESKIQDGFVDNVSIGFELDPICSECGKDFRYCEHWFDEAHVIAKNCRCYEQSIVPFGADENTTVEPGASFSHGTDFTLQFAYKNDNDFKAQLEPKLEVSHYSGTWTDKTTSTTFDYDYSYPSITPPIVTYTTLSSDGDKMEHEERIAELEAEVKALQDTIDAQDAEIETLKTEITAKEDQIGELTGIIQEYKDAEEATIEDEKDSLAKKIAGIELEKGKITEEDIDARVESLKEKFDVETLEALLDAHKTSTPEPSAKPKIGGVTDTQTGESALESSKVDPEEERIQALSKMFNMKIQKRE
jgi:hypothetical protein